MPIEKLSKAQVAKLMAPRGRAPNPEYVQFLQSNKPGVVGRATVASENVSKQSIKNRLTRASKATGVPIKFHRTSDPDEVIFEIVSK